MHHDRRTTASTARARWPLALMLLALLVLPLTACGTGGTTEPVYQDLVVVGDGPGLKVYRASVNGYEMVGSATLPLGGLLAGHYIFGLVQHPTQNWIYASSFNECWSGDDWCWGNGRIDRFTYTSDGTVSHAGQVFDFSSSPLSCGSEDWGYPGQTGTCAPVEMTFSADGTRMYVQEDNDDEFIILSCDVAGNLGFVAIGGGTDLHGVARHPAATYVYNGGATYNVAGDVAVMTADPGGRGNAPQVSWLGGAWRLFTTEDNQTLAAYDLSNPASPTLLDDIDVGSASGGSYGGYARYQRTSADGTRTVCAGLNRVTSVGWNGAAFTILDTWDSETVTDEFGRGVALCAGDRVAFVPWLRAYDLNDEKDFDGGVIVFLLATDGTLTPIGYEHYGRPTRAALALR